MKKLCIIKNCQSPNYCRTYCVLHYGRFKRNGDPLKTIRNTGDNRLALKPEYKTWAGMLTRCRNKNINNYERYGGRGITVCERWLDFRNFYKDMGDKPSPKHSLDRIDNDGNYEPSNCRWATDTEQAQNKSGYKNNASGFAGVSFNKQYGKWRAYYCVNKKVLFIGYYETAEKANTARKQYIQNILQAE